MSYEGHAERIIRNRAAIRTQDEIARVTAAETHAQEINELLPQIRNLAAFVASRSVQHNFSIPGLDWKIMRRYQSAPAPDTESKPRRRWFRRPPDPLLQTGTELVRIPVLNLTAPGLSFNTYQDPDLDNSADDPNVVKLDSEGNVFGPVDRFAPSVLKSLEGFAQVIRSYQDANPRPTQH